MFRTPVLRKLRRIIPVFPAVLLAVGLPSGAEARGGGSAAGGIGLGGGGLAAVHGGGLGRGGVVVAPHRTVGVVGSAQRAAVGVVGSAQRAAVGVVGSAQRAAIGFSHGGAIAFPGRLGFPHGDVVALSGRRLFPHGDLVVRVPPGQGVFGFGALGIPPLLGTAVPPLVGVTVPPLTGTGVPPLVGATVPFPTRLDAGAIEVWRRHGGGWHLDPIPLPVAAWRRDQDGRWQPQAAN